MTDIVERLRDAASRGGFSHLNVCTEAADEIERLRNNLEISLKQFEELAWQHAATIEHCARVVEQWFQERGENDSPYVAPLAAAIRALKDRP